MLPNRSAAAEQPEALEGPARSVFCLSLRSGAEIGVMARVVQTLARRSLMPSRWHSAAAGEHLLTDVQILGLSPGEGELLAEALRQIVGVEEVLTSRFARRSAA